MRRFYSSIFAIGFFLGMLTGCQNFFCHTAGVCDCDFDDDQCAHRAPWVRPTGVAPIAGGGGCASGNCGGGAAIDVANRGGNAVQAQPVSRTK